MVRTWSRPYGLCHHPYTLAHIKGFGSPVLHVYAWLLLRFIFHASLYNSRLCHVWCPPRAWSCLITSNAHEALFRCNHLVCIAMMPVATCIPSPFMLCTMVCLPCLFVPPLALYASLHACLHVHVWVLLASVLSMLQHNKAIDIWSKPTFVPLHCWWGLTFFGDFISPSVGVWIEHQ